MTTFKVGDRVKGIDFLTTKYYKHLQDKTGTVEAVSHSLIYVKFDEYTEVTQWERHRLELVSPNPVIRIPRKPVVEYDEVEVKPGTVLNWNLTGDKYIIDVDFMLHKIDRKTFIEANDLKNEAGNWSVVSV